MPLWHPAAPQPVPVASQPKDDKRRANRELGLKRVGGGLLCLLGGLALSGLGNKIFVYPLAVGVVYLLGG